MTEGIIQQIFNKHLSGKEMTLDYTLTFRTIQQELIEKIKQEFEQYRNDTSPADLYRRIIGDTQQ